jgi:ankyrin repeat protein
MIDINAKFLNACKKGNIELAKDLMNNYQIDVNKTDHAGRTPLYLACNNGHLQVVELLTTNMLVELNKADNQKRTAFATACNNGHAKIVSLLIKNELVDITATDIYGRTPLHLSCLNNHSDVVKILIGDARVDVNIKNYRGCTPFYSACSNFNKEVVQIMMKDERVDVNMQDNEGTTPFCAAYRRGFKKMIDYLIKDDRINTLNITSTPLPSYLTCIDYIKKILTQILKEHPVLCKAQKNITKNHFSKKELVDTLHFLSANSKNASTYQIKAIKELVLAIKKPNIEVESTSIPNTIDALIEYKTTLLTIMGLESQSLEE